MNNSGIGGLKIKDYLKMAETYMPHWDKDMAEHLLNIFHLDRKKRISKLSKGMTSMITIIVALASKADFTLLDEPVAGLNPFLSPFGLPCKQPAWGYISALDLKTNEVVWKKRIGTPQDSLPFPMPVKLPFTMGMPMLGGPISTAGNVLFIGATMH